MVTPLTPVGHKKIRKETLCALLAALLGGVVFLFLYGASVLDPTNVGWFINRGEDPRQHYYGWQLFRQSRWMFPLGLMDTCVYPHPVSVIYTDSLPLLAVFFKLLSPLLPSDFQYFGIWGLCCYMLMGFFGAKLLARFTGNAAVTVGGSLLFSTAPVLIWRMYGHTALAGQWLILAALWLFFRQADAHCAFSWRRAAAWGVLGFFVSSIHLYYLAMCGIICLGSALCWLLRTKKFRQACAPPLAFIGVSLCTVFLWGGFSSAFSGKSNGYIAGLDPRYFFAPGGYSRLFPGGAVTDYESFSWLGLGALILLALALGAGVYKLVRAGRQGIARWVGGHKGIFFGSVLILLVSFCVSLGADITVNGLPLLHLPLPALLRRAWSMFSSTARIAWVTIYFLYLLAAGLLAKWGGKRLGAAAVLLCVAIQIADCSGAMADKRQETIKWENTPATSSLTDPAWETIGRTEKLAHVAYASMDARDAVLEKDMLAYAVRYRKTLNTFYLAHARVDAEAQSIRDDLNALRDDTLYIFAAGDELLCPWYSLNYYRIDGLLVGTVDELPLPDYREADMTKPTVTEKLAYPVTVTGALPFSLQGAPLRTGTYVVTIDGQNLDQSYIYGVTYPLAAQTAEELDIRFLTAAPEKMALQFTLLEEKREWNVNVHALADATVSIDRITVQRTG